MKRVTGIGGIFFKANDPKALAAWYRDHHVELQLGTKVSAIDPDGHTVSLPDGTTVPRALALAWVYVAHSDSTVAGQPVRGTTSPLTATAKSPNAVNFQRLLTVSSSSRSVHAPLASLESVEAVPASR